MALASAATAAAAAAAAAVTPAVAPAAAAIAAPAAVITAVRERDRLDHIAGRVEAVFRFWATRRNGARAQATGGAALRRARDRIDYRARGRGGLRNAPIRA